MEAFVSACQNDKIKLLAAVKRFYQSLEVVRRKSWSGFYITPDDEHTTAALTVVERLETVSSRITFVCLRGESDKVGGLCRAIISYNPFNPRCLSLIEVQLIVNTIDPVCIRAERGQITELRSFDDLPIFDRATGWDLATAAAHTLVEEDIIP